MSCKFWIECTTVSGIQVPQRMLQRLRMNRAQERVFSLQECKVAAHGGVGQSLLAAFITQFIHCEKYVPHEPRTTGESPQRCSVGCARLQTEAVALAAYHCLNYADHYAIRLSFCEC